MPTYRSFTAAIQQGTAPANNTNPFLALRATSKRVGITGLEALVNNASPSFLLQSICRETAAAMAGTAVPLHPKILTPPNIQEATSLLVVNGSVATAAVSVRTIGNIPVAGTAASPTLVPLAIVGQEIGNPGPPSGRTWGRVACNGAAAPVQDDWKLTVTTGTAALVFWAKAGGDTDTATNKYFDPGATYATFTAALAAKINSVLGAPVAEALTVNSIEMVYVEKYVPTVAYGMISAVAETNDPGPDTLVTDNVLEWITLTASATNAIGGTLVVTEQD